MARYYCMALLIPQDAVRDVSEADADFILAELEVISDAFQHRDVRVWVEPDLEIDDEELL